MKRTFYFTLNNINELIMDIIPFNQDVNYNIFFITLFEDINGIIEILREGRITKDNFKKILNAFEFVLMGSEVCHDSKSIFELKRVIGIWWIKIIEVMSIKRDWYNYNYELEKCYFVDSGAEYNDADFKITEYAYRKILPNAVPDQKLIRSKLRLVLDRWGSLGEDLG